MVELSISAKCSMLMVVLRMFEERKLRVVMLLLTALRRVVTGGAIARVICMRMTFDGPEKFQPKMVSESLRVPGLTWKEIPALLMVDGTAKKS